MHLLGFWLHSGSGSVLNNANPLNALNAAGALRANSLFLFFFSACTRKSKIAHTARFCFHNFPHSLFRFLSFSLALSRGFASGCAPWLKYFRTTLARARRTKTSVCYLVCTKSFSDRLRLHFQLFSTPFSVPLYPTRFSWLFFVHFFAVAPLFA